MEQENYDNTTGCPHLSSGGYVYVCISRGNQSCDNGHHDDCDWIDICFDDCGHGGHPDNVVSVHGVSGLHGSCLDF